MSGCTKLVEGKRQLKLDVSLRSARDTSGTDGEVCDEERMNGSFKGLNRKEKRWMTGVRVLGST